VTEEEQIAVWRTAIDACDDLYSFNRYIARYMNSRGDTFLRMAIAEARKRNYAVEKIDGDKTGRYIQAPKPLNMQLTKGHGIIRVDWMDGTLYAQFSNSDRIYEFERVPEQWFQNILRSPYPDALFAGYKKRLEVREAQKETPTDVS
jgi:hypothetical protein